MANRNENENNSYILNFSNADRVQYGDSSYPSTIIPMEDDNGGISNRRVFFGGNSQLYSMDGNTPRPVIMTYNLPEVTVTSPKLNRPLTASINDLSVLSNDNTQVNNIPYGRYDVPRKEYNQHLKERTLKGMAQEGAWRNAHPNQAAWSDALAAAPFAVASIPFIAGAGQAVGDTAFGVAAKDAIGSTFNSPLGRMINAGLGYYGLREGVNDIYHGKFTPETALDLVGGAGSTIYEGIRAGRNAGNAIINAIEKRYTPEQIQNAVSKFTGYGDKATTFITNSMNSLRNALRFNRNVPSRVINDDDYVFDEGALNAIENLNAQSGNLAEVGTQVVPFGSTLRRMVQPTTVDNVATASTNPANVSRTIKARDTRKGELPYTDEEINALVDENGNLRPDIEWDSRSQVRTGAHGDFGQSWNTPKEILQKHLNAADPSNPRNGMQELRYIRRDNPKGRSGVLIKTHSGDTSIDSTPLAYSIALTQGKKFKPLTTSESRITSNEFGYNNVFAEDRATADRARAAFAANPDAEVKLIKDTKGNMVAMEMTDNQGTFLIPLRSRQQVMDIINKRLHAFNEHFGTNYEDVTPEYSTKTSKFFDPNNPYPWDFGEAFSLPNIYGIAYKKGGRLHRRGLTF